MNTRAAGIFFAGAYYLGEHRQRHTWTNFAASGAAAGTAISLWMIWPIRLRTTLFGTALGAALGSAAAYGVEVRRRDACGLRRWRAGGMFATQRLECAMRGGAQAAGVPFWDERRDFEGWWWGKYVDLKRERRERQLQEQRRQQEQPPGAAPLAQTS